MQHHAHLSIAGLVTGIENSRNQKDMALAIGKAFEQMVNWQNDHLATKHDLALVKTELIQLEANFDKKLLSLELKLNEKISNSKWQVIGTVIGAFLLPIALRHLGI